MNADIAAKRFELIRELVPQAADYFGLVNPASPLAQPMTKALEAGAATLGIPLKILRASSNAEIDAVMRNASIHCQRNSIRHRCLFLRPPRIYCRAGAAPSPAYNL